MFKKLFVTAAAAAAVSVPLAGVASADQPTDPGVGAGGVPGRIGEAPGGPGTPTPPGTLISKAQQDARDLGFKNLPDRLRSMPGSPIRSPGDAISDIVHLPPPAQGGGSTVTPPNAPVPTPGTPEQPPALPVPTPGTPDQPGALGPVPAPPPPLEPLPGDAPPVM